LNKGYQSLITFHFSRMLSRRAFLKIASLSLGGLALRPFGGLFALPDFPQGDRLGRVNAGKVELKARPDADSQTQGELFEDAVVPWLREVAGTNVYRDNQRWVETPDGYIWSPYLQPVSNQPNRPLEALPENATLGTGMWVEVTVPYADLLLDNPPARAPWLEYKLENGIPPRLYYSQITWVDQMMVDSDGRTLYRVNEKYGSYGDVFWSAAEAFRPLTDEDLTPIHPDVGEKRILVDIAHQVLSCYEGNREVYFTRISSGALWNARGERVDVWETPVGRFPIWRKLLSLHMSGGTTGGGWDLPAIGWVSLFVGSGVAVHATFWHNNFGEPMSNGCVNARPEDAKWVFRWTRPPVAYDPGDLTIPLPGGTIVEVVES
jgi:lipoprotein-anchoring transpeptidase ErfK/SrfK